MIYDIMRAFIEAIAVRHLAPLLPRDARYELVELVGGELLGPETIIRYHWSRT